MEGAADEASTMEEADCDGGFWKNSTHFLRVPARAALHGNLDFSAWPSCLAVTCSVCGCCLLCTGNWILLVMRHSGIISHIHHVKCDAQFALENLDMFRWWVRVKWTVFRRDSDVESTFRLSTAHSFSLCAA